jgi:V/A-type H+-transporting ATPase subunit A
MLYADAVEGWWSQISPDWATTRATALRILQQESELEEIVRLVGPEALPDGDKLLMAVARMIREDFLAQSAYHAIDTYCVPARAHQMLSVIIRYNELAQESLKNGVDVNELRYSPIVTRISRLKDIPNEEFEQNVKQIISDMETSLVSGKGGA